MYRILSSQAFILSPAPLPSKLQRQQSNSPKRPSFSSSRSLPKCLQTLEPPNLVRPPKRPAAAPKLTADGDDMTVTPLQQFLVRTFTLVSATFTAKQFVSSTSPLELSAHVAAIVAAYVFTDLAVGIYHHAVDNYGSESTPIFGYQIAAFQGHHRYPWTITARATSNNLYRLTIPTLPQLSLLFLLPPSPFVTFYGSFLIFIVMAQEAHRQAHMTRSAGWVRALQDIGLLVKPKAHARHHLSPHEGNYCILSGHWNEVLDNAGAFRLWEGLVFKMTGVEPICWSEDPRLREEALQKLQAWWR